MVKAFLSHSSQDKFNYVEFIATSLGRSAVVYDKVSFEAGQKTIHEIVKGIDGALIFVLFISDSSLNSDWVRFEMEKARDQLVATTEKHFLPIVVDPIIAYNDSRIPVWMKEEYNLRYLKPKGALRAIQSKIREVTWRIIPELKKKETIFHGRYDEKSKFTLRYFATDKMKPVACIASGIKRIGKLAFLKRCLMENRISLSQCYEYPEISLHSDEGLENFIQYSLDLDIADHPPAINLISRSYEEKIGILSDIYRSLNNPSEIIAIRDNSCIVRRSGEVAEWFLDFIRSMSSLNSIYFIVSSESSPRNLRSMDEVYCINICPLSKVEQRVLLVDYLHSLFGLKIPGDEIEIALSWVKGFPKQIFYLAQVFSKFDGSFANVKKLSDDISRCGDEFANMAIQKYADSEKAKEVLALLAYAVGIQKDFLVKAFAGDKDKIDLLIEFEILSICHSAGTSREYLLLDGALRDAVQRLRYKPNFNELQVIISEIKNNIADEGQGDVFSRSSYIEQQLASGKEVSLKYVLPSHFITAIRQSYHSQNYNQAISLCTRLYDSGASIDSHLMQVARFYECMAKIRKREDISGLLPLHREPERSFLRGFSARARGDLRSALSDFKSAYERNRDYHYARNEYISLKIQIGDVDEVAPIARDEFDKNKTNVYVAQSYFNCLLSQFNRTQDSKIVEEVRRVLAHLPKVADKKLLQMKYCMSAEGAFYIDNNIGKALEILDACDCEIGENIYTLFTRESILSYYNKLDEAQEVLNRIKEIRADANAFTDRIAKAQALIYARRGNYAAAEHVSSSGLRYYPVETRNSFLEYLYKVSVGRFKGN